MMRCIISCRLVEPAPVINLIIWSVSMCYHLHSNNQPPEAQNSASIKVDIKYVNVRIIHCVYFVDASSLIHYHDYSHFHIILSNSIFNISISISWLVEIPKTFIINDNSKNLMFKTWIVCLLSYFLSGSWWVKFESLWEFWHKALGFERSVEDEDESGRNLKNFKSLNISVN